MLDNLFFAHSHSLDECKLADEVIVKFKLLHSRSQPFGHTSVAEINEMLVEILEDSRTCIDVIAESRDSKRNRSIVIRARIANKEKRKESA